ncbi:MAG: hypothetical protein ACRC6T_07040 [Sarcina sp.]
MDLKELGKKLKLTTDEYLKNIIIDNLDREILNEIEDKRNELIYKISNIAYMKGKLINLQSLSNGNIIFNDDEKKNINYLKEKVTTFIDKSMREMNILKEEPNYFENPLEIISINFETATKTELDKYEFELEKKLSKERRNLEKKINSKYFFKVKEVLSVLNLDSSLYLAFNHGEEVEIIAQEYNKVEHKVELIDEIMDSLKCIKSAIVNLE